MASADVFRYSPVHKECGMNRDHLIARAESAIADLRAALRENDGSGVQTLVSGVSGALGTIKQNVMQNEAARKTAEDARRCLDEFGQAVRKGDREVPARLLDKAEGLLRRLKTENNDKEPQS